MSLSIQYEYPIPVGQTSPPPLWAVIFNGDTGLVWSPSAGATTPAKGWVTDGTDVAISLPVIQAQALQAVRAITVPQIPVMARPRQYTVWILNSIGGWPIDAIEVDLYNPPVPGPLLLADAESFSP